MLPRKRIEDQFTVPEKVRNIRQDGNPEVASELGKLTRSAPGSVLMAWDRFSKQSPLDRTGHEKQRRPILDQRAKDSWEKRLNSGYLT